MQLERERERERAQCIHYIPERERLTCAWRYEPKKCILMYEYRVVSKKSIHITFVTVCCVGPASATNVVFCNVTFVVRYEPAVHHGGS